MLNDNDNFPQVSKALIEELERRFPDKMPEGYLKMKHIRVKQGELNVVRFLRERYEEQVGIFGGHT